MNTIQEPSASSLLSITSSKCTLKIPVKIGSNQIYVNISKETKCSQVIRQALNQCKIKTNYRTILIGDMATAKVKSQRHCISRDSYALFERAAGIEQMIKSDQNIFELWLQWKLRRTEIKVEFIIKKCTNKRVSSVIARNKKINSHKLFEIGRQKAGVVKTYPTKIDNNKLSYEIQTHLYEKIDDIDTGNFSTGSSNMQEVSQEPSCKETSKKIKFNLSILRQVQNVKRIINHLSKDKQTY